MAKKKKLKEISFTKAAELLKKFDVVKEHTNYNSVTLYLSNNYQLEFFSMTDYHSSDPPIVEYTPIEPYEITAETMMEMLKAEGNVKVDGGDMIILKHGTLTLTDRKVMYAPSTVPGSGL